MKYILTIISIIILQCCWGPKEFQLMKKEDNNTVPKVLKGTYQITHLETEDISTHNVTITFNNSTKQVSGFSGCNRFFGSYSIEGNTLKFGDLGSTRMMCEENANSVESKFLKTLNKAHVILFGKDGGFSLFNKKELLLNATKPIVFDNSELEYTASSRGFFKQIIINKKTISTSNQIDSKLAIKNCNDDFWQKITENLKNISIETIPNLEAPSKAFLYDGAAFAKLKITHKGKLYESEPFDHGNPPKAIKNLVKEILSISENIE